MFVLLYYYKCSNIHKRYGYFSNEKTNSSLQLFITTTRELPRDGDNVHSTERNCWLMRLIYQQVDKAIIFGSLSYNNIHEYNLRQEIIRDYIFSCARSSFFRLIIDAFKIKFSSM